MTFIPLQCSNNMIKCENIESDNLEQFFQQAEASRQRRLARMHKQKIEQYVHFVALVVDENGEIQFKSSPSLRPQKAYLLEEAYHRLIASLTDMRFPEQEVLRETLDDTTRARSINHPTFSNPELSKGSISLPFQRPAKRHRSSTMHGHAKDHRVIRDEKADIKALTAHDHKKVEISVCNRDAMKLWFSEAFKAVQQVGCRLIAKVWIKKIHPKKQSTHPYNGGYPRNEPADSNRTKPPYWPEGIKHKEPDHIDRNARTALLVHLIMNTPQPQILTCADPNKQELISAKDLLKSLEEKKGDFKAERWPIIQHIVQARTFMEQYENGEIVDPNFMICLPDYSDTSRMAQGDSETDGPDADEEPLDSTLNGHGDEDNIQTVDLLNHSPALLSSTANGGNDDFNAFSNGTSTFSQVFDPDMIQPMPKEPSQGTFSSSNFHSSQSGGNLQLVSNTSTVNSLTPTCNMGNELESGMMHEQESVQKLALLDQQDCDRTIDHLAVNTWVPTFPSDLFIQNPYSLSHVLDHPTLSVGESGNFDHDSVHLARHHQMMDVAQSLPLLETGICQNYSTEMQRILPLRTMSNTHSGILTQVSYETNRTRRPFYNT